MAVKSVQVRWLRHGNSLHSDRRAATYQQGGENRSSFPAGSRLRWWFCWKSWVKNSVWDLMFAGLTLYKPVLVLAKMAYFKAQPLRASELSRHFYGSGSKQWSPQAASPKIWTSALAQLPAFMPWNAASDKSKQLLPYVSLWGRCFTVVWDLKERVEM